MPTRSDSTSTDGVEPRVAALEGFVKGLDEDIKGLQSAFDRNTIETRSTQQRLFDLVERQGAGFQKSINELERSLSDRRETKWNTLANWAAVIISLGGVLGFLTLQPVKDRIENLAEEFRVHESIEGHSGTSAKLAAMHVQFTEIETQFNAGKDIIALLRDNNIERLDHLSEVTELKRLLGSKPEKIEP
mgnify:FL=1